MCPVFFSHVFCCWKVCSFKFKIIAQDLRQVSDRHHEATSHHCHHWMFVDFQLPGHFGDGWGPVIARAQFVGAWDEVGFRFSSHITETITHITPQKHIHISTFTLLLPIALRWWWKERERTKKTHHRKHRSCLYSPHLEIHQHCWFSRSTNIVYFPYCFVPLFGLALRSWGVPSPFAVPFWATCSTCRIFATSSQRSPGRGCCSWGITWRRRRKTKWRQEDKREELYCWTGVGYGMYSCEGLGRQYDASNVISKEAKALGFCRTDGQNHLEIISNHMLLNPSQSIRDFFQPWNGPPEGHRHHPLLAIWQGMGQWGVDSSATAQDQATGLQNQRECVKFVEIWHIPIFMIPWYLVNSMFQVRPLCGDVVLGSYDLLGIQTAFGYCAVRRSLATALTFAPSASGTSRESIRFTSQQVQSRI